MPTVRLVLPRELIAPTVKPISRGFLHCRIAVPASYCSQQMRASSFLHDNSNTSSARQPQKSGRESWFARRRKARNARSKISTLALDHNPSTTEAEPQDQQEQSRSEDRSKDGHKARAISTRSRKILLLTLVLTMPVWGRDIIEAVVPGIVGLLILGAGKIKSAIGWLRSTYQERKR